MRLGEPGHLGPSLSQGAPPVEAVFPPRLQLSPDGLVKFLLLPSSPGHYDFRVSHILWSFSQSIGCDLLTSSSCFTNKFKECP